VASISNNGAGVSWIFRYDGRRFGYPGDVPMGLGSYGTVDLDMARELAHQYRLMLSEGKDPKVGRDDRLLDDQIVRGAAKTVNQVADEYFEAKVARKSASYRWQTEKWFKTFLRDKIGQWPIQKVDTNTILETCELRDLWIAQNPTARGLQNHLSRMFDLAIARGYYRGGNPAAWKGLQHILPSSSDVHQTKHHASLPYKDVARFMEKLRAYKDTRLTYPNIRTTVSLAVEFIILTGVRLSEVRLATWNEIDHRVWNVPPEHRKTGYRNGKVRPIPITEPMLAVLEEMAKRRTDQSPDAIVFPWARRKFKRLRHQIKGARDWFAQLRCANPKLFAHWQLCHGNGRATGAV
jgi:integrase